MNSGCSVPRGAIFDGSTDDAMASLVPCGRVLGGGPVLGDDARH
jgi:hypothetical protein